MKRLLLAAAFSFLFVTAGSSLSSDNVTAGIHLRLKQPVKGMVYGVYKDASYTELLKNEKNEELRLITDEKGEAEVSVSADSYYIHQIKSAPGYYLDTESYTEDDSLEDLSVFTIDLLFDMKGFENSHLQIMDANDHKVLADWNKGKTALHEGIPYLFEGGETYLLHAPDAGELTVCNDLIFTVSEYWKETPVYSLEKKEYGMLSVLNKDSEEKLLQGSAFGLYKDAETAELALQMNEEKAQGICDDQASISFAVAPGTYYLKQLKVNSFFYAEEEVRKIEVQAGKTIETIWKNEDIQGIFSIKDSATGKDLPGELILTDGKEKKMLHLLRETALERGKTYTLKETGHPNDYFHGKDIVFTVPQINEGRIEQAVMCTPFQVQMEYLNKRTMRRADTGKFEVIDTLDDSAVMHFDTHGEINAMSDLKSGHSYRIHQLSSSPGYLLSEDSMIDIPLETDGTGLQIIPAQMCSDTYAVLKAGSFDDGGNVLKSTEITLYRDQMGKEILKDTAGRNAVIHTDQNHAETLNLNNGTYYWKVTKFPEGYYRDETMHTVIADHEERPVGVLRSVLQHAGMRIQCTDRQNQDIANACIEIFHDGRSEGIAEVSGNAFMMKLPSGKEIIPGETYGIKIAEAPGLYTYSRDVQTLMIPETAPEEIPHLTAVMDPYITVSAFEGNEKQMIKGSSYSLFTDAYCTKIAYDIQGRTASGMTDKNGKASWAVREGRYWLKQTDTAGHTYRNQTVVQFTADSAKQWEQKFHFTSMPVTLSLRLNDENGNQIRSGSYDVFSQDGKLLYRWDSGLRAPMEGNWLKAGGTYRFHEKTAPEGYKSNSTDLVYTLSQEQPEEAPVIVIAYEKTEHRNASAIEENNSKGSLQPISWHLPVFCFGAMLVFVIAVKVFINMKNSAKTD
jgi:hypothetical protein